MAIVRNYDMVQLYFDYGIDLTKRRIYFGDTSFEDGNDFDFCSVATALRAIDKMLDMNKKPIELHMSSYGGEIDMMHALIDKIQESKCQFKFYGSGMIMSCAAWTMSVCDERYVSPHTRIMVHHGSNGTPGSVPVHDMEILSKENKFFMEQGVEILAKNSRMPKNFWETIMKHDVYLSPEEAKDLGIVDAIIEYRKRGNFRRGVRAANFKATPSTTKMRKLIKTLFDRAEFDTISDIQIHIPKEEYEPLPEDVDNTEEELKNLIKPVEFEHEQKDK